MKTLPPNLDLELRRQMQAEQRRIYERSDLDRLVSWLRLPRPLPDNEGRISRKNETSPLT